MGLFSFFKRPLPAADAAAAEATGDEVQRARSRARQRLIGAVVLVGIGVVGFPLLFETHPRPIPVDIPIDIASKDKAPALAMPPTRGSASGVPASAPPSVALVTAAPASRAAPRDEVITEAPAASPRDASKPAAAGGTEAARARSLLEGGVAAKSTAPAASASDAAARFVVQVGAFAEATAVRDARQKVEKLGFKTYTQVVDTAAGSRTRVRVGPFAAHDEAAQAVAKLKAAGLPAALLTL